MAATPTLSTPSTPSITTSVIDLQGRVVDVLNHPLWNDVRNGYFRSVVERAQLGLANVDLDVLTDVLAKVEQLLSTMSNGKRRRELEKARQSIIQRRWWYRFVRANPEAAVLLEAELPEHTQCTTEQFEAVQSAIDAAKLWSREQHEQRMEKLTQRCDTVKRKADAFAEFAFVDAEAHAFIAAGPAHDMDLHPLEAAINSFHNWLNGSSNGATLNRMGLSTTPAGKTNRSKGKRRAK
jgi:hypothetical protein